MRRGQWSFDRKPGSIVAQLELRGVASRARRAAAAAAPSLQSPSRSGFRFQKWYSSKADYEVGLNGLHHQKDATFRVWRGSSSASCHVAFCKHTHDILKRFDGVARTSNETGCPSRAGRGANESRLLAAFSAEGACQFLAVGQQCTRLEALQAKWRTLPLMDALSDGGFTGALTCALNACSRWYALVCRPSL